MSKLDAYVTSLPSLYPKCERDLVPIRSIVYKKKSDGARDTALKKVSRSSVSEVPYSVIASQKDVKPLKIPTVIPQTAQTYRDASQPHVIYQIHKISLGKKAKVQTARSSPVPMPMHMKTLQKSAMKSQMHSRRESTTNVTTDQTDYFDILRDENRKTFKGANYEGVDDYSPEVVMSKIYSQGFRDPEYYSKAVNFARLEAPEEKEIKEKYNFKIASWIAPMENEKTLATHVLGGAANNVTYVESLLEAAQEANEELIKQKTELKEEMDELNRKFTEEMENLVSDYSRRFKDMDDFVKNDYIKKQTEGFKLQKEVMLLKREKMMLEKKVAEAVATLNGVENILYGRKIFDLEPVHKELETISDMNLRNERAGLMRNSQFIH